MIPLTFGNRANHKNFPTNADEWDPHLVFSLEKSVIDAHLRTQAARGWEEFEDVDRAFGPIQGLDHTLATYVNSGNMPPRYDEAVDGRLQLAAPTKGNIRALTILLALSVIAESTVMLIQQALTMDFNPFIVVIAFMLALGGFLQGHGIGNLLFKGWQKDTGRAEEIDRPLIYWLEVAVGTLLILLIALLRGATAFDPVMMFLVFSITLLFGEAVSLFEALRKKYKEMRITLLDEMLLAQKWRASKLHQELLVNKGYHETYINELAKRSGKQISVSDKPEAVPPTPDTFPHNVYPTGGDQR
jgi:hypothetical protein